MESSTAPPIVIRPPTGWGTLRLRELSEFRELLFFLTKRELQIRYKQSLFGISWAILQPIAMAAIFSLFFGLLAELDSEGVPYPLFVLAALVPWLYNSQAVSQATTSLVADASLIGKVYFPRMVVPLSRTISYLVDLCVTIVVLLALMVLYGTSFQATTPLVVVFIALALIVATGAGLLFSALNVRYRDLGVAVPLLLQIWLFSSPVVYPSSLIPGNWQYLYAINPMSTVIDGVRWSLFATEGPALGAVAISVVAAFALLLGSAMYFRKAETFFADIV